VVLYFHIENVTTVRENYHLTYNLKLEVIWTVIPIFILVLITTPSFVLLFTLDKLVIDSSYIVVKVIGNQ
jgi:heme/copper-type cytochrome/quinol oxidase subunit 2